MEYEEGSRWRLDPRLIVAAVRDEQPRSYRLARTIFGAGTTSVIVFVSGPPLFSWPLLVGAVVGTVVAIITSGKALLQISAEITGIMRKAPRSMRSKGRGEEVMSAGAVRPGAWICHYEDYEERRSKAEEDYRQRLEQHERQEDDRIEIAREQWKARRKLDAERGITYPVSYRPYELQRRPFLGQKHMPKKDFRLAVVAHKSDDAQSVSLGMLHGKSRNVGVGEKFYVRQQKDRRSAGVEQVDDAAAAFVGLIENLALGARSEEAVILALQEHYSGGAIRHAIRGALATNLIRRRRGPVRLLCELLCVFSVVSYRAVEQRRTTELTRLGEMWLDADRAARAASARHADVSYTEGGHVTSNFHFYGGQSFYNSPVGSTIHNGPQTEIQLNVGDILSRTIEMLDCQCDGIRQTSDPEALEEAILEIRSVVEGERLDDSKLASALRVIMRTGEGLFLGVAGNALYSELLQLVDLLSKK